MKTLSGVDGAFLHLETPETPMHVASLSLFELPPGYKGKFFNDVKREIRKRLGLVPVFTRKLAPMPLQFANPAWITQERVNLGYHLQHIRLPAPGTLAQLEDCVGRCIPSCSTAASRCGGSPSSTASNPGWWGITSRSTTRCSMGKPA